MYETTQSEVQQIAVSQFPRFSVKFDGDAAAKTYTLQEMLEANRDDEDFCLWLRSAPPVGAGRIWGGGAAPVCHVRRVS